MRIISRLLTIAAATLAAVFGASAEIPSGYYTSIEGKATSELKTALYNIIRNQSQQQTYSRLPTYFQRTDTYPNSSRWWDMYSDTPLYAPSFSGLNREHSLPKSWWGGSQNVPAYTDLNHLYPSEMQANTAKSNYPLGIVTDGGSRFNNSVVMVGRGQNSGGAAYVFEPADEYKGDFARTYFYMVTCYQDFDWRYQYMCMNGTYPSMQQWAIDLLLKWHRGDPVSQKELDRNEQVYLIQANRNPFIDYPDLVEYIWGDKKGQAFKFGGGSVTPGEAVLITPPNKMALDFNRVAVGRTSQAKLQIRGEKLTKPLRLTISGINRSLFTLSESQVSASAVNAPEGTWVTVNYAPTSVGSHTARLIINMDEADFPDELSRVIQITGECLPMPGLSTPVATPASNVTASGFTANWEAAPASEDVDYYMVTLRRYKGSDVTTEELPADNNYLDIDEMEGVDYATYAVQSVSLDVRSAMSNVITVNPPSGIEGVMTDVRPFTVESFPGMLRIVCSETHHDVTVYDLTGRTVMLLPEAADGYEFTLPAGAYLINSREHPVPVKVIAH